MLSKFYQILLSTVLYMIPPVSSAGAFDPNLSLSDFNSAKKRNHSLHDAMHHPENMEMLFSEQC